MSLAAEIIEYMGGLVLSGGDHDGRLLEVLPWERQFVRGVFSRTGDAAISCARGNGKTLVVAAIASAVVDPSGPLHGNRREVICVASSFAQSKIIFEDVLAFLGERFDLDDRSRWRKQDSQNAALLEFRASGARIRCIGADPRKMHSLRPYLAVVDEPAQHNPAQTDRMLAAIRTGLGKTPGSRLIALGTRSHDSGHWFSRMLESADYSQVHAMRPDGSPFTLKQIRRANPSYDHLPSLAKRIQAEIRDARVDPDARAAWVALRGNGGQSDVDRSVLVDSATWSRAESLPEADRSGGYVLGLDVSSTQSMTCAVAYFRSGRVECFGMFPEHPDLRTRGLQDGVGGLYLTMQKRGELLTRGQLVVDIDELLSECLVRWGVPQAMVMDRWREASVRQAADKVRFPPSAIVIRGQGFLDQGNDINALRRAILGGHVQPVESLLLRSALAETVTMTDPGGSEKITRKGARRRSRNDAAVALTLAVAAGYREWHAAPRKRARYRSAVVG